MEALANLPSEQSFPMPAVDSPGHLQHTGAGPHSRDFDVIGLGWPMPSVVSPQKGMLKC